MNKRKIVIAGVSLVSLVALVAAINVLTATIHTGTPESQQLYWANNSINWQQLYLGGSGAIDLGNQNIGVGDYQDISFNATNTAKLPLQYTFEIPTQSNVTASFACNQSGVQYATDTSDSTKFVIKIKNAGLTTSIFNWRSTVSADAPATNGTYPVDRTFSFARGSVNATQNWTSC